MIEFSSVEYWPGNQLVHKEFAFNVLYLPGAQREIMLFIGKPKGRSRMISNPGAHPVHVPLF